MSPLILNNELSKGNLVRIKNRSNQASELATDIDASYSENTSTDSIRNNDKNVNAKKSLDVTHYMTAAENGDEESAQKYVDEAAMKWGAYSVDGKTPLKLYHGTQHFGFTELDLDRMDDKRSIGNGKELRKKRIEELNDPNSADDINRAYILQNIKEEALSTNYHFSKAVSVDKTSSTYKIADLVSLVKNFDNEHSAKEVNKVFLNEDETLNSIFTKL